MSYFAPPVGCCPSRLRDMYSVYILKSEVEYCIGITMDINTSMLSFKREMAYTGVIDPSLAFVYCEHFSSARSALKREKELKTLDKKSLERLIRQNSRKSSKTKAS